MNNTYDINKESKALSNEILSTFNLKSKIIFNEEIIIEEFFLSKLNLFKHYLLANSSFINFKVEYNFKPEYVAIEYLKSKLYGFLILYLNNIQTKREFHINKINKILVPSISVIENIESNIDITQVIEKIDIDKYKLYQI